MYLGACKKCRRLYQSIKLSAFCPDCLVNYKDIEFETIKEYLEKHPGCNAMMVSNATNIAISDIFKYIDDGRIFANYTNASNVLDTLSLNPDTKNNAKSK